MESLSGTPPLSDEPRFESIQRRWQRAGWVLIILFLAAALLGAFGPGLLPQNRAKAGPFSLAYETVIHRDAPTRLEVHFTASGPDQQLRVGLSDSYLRMVRIESINPRPQSASATSSGVLWTFLTEEPAGAIFFEVSPASAGTARGRLSAGGETIPFSQYIMP